VEFLARVCSVSDMFHTDVGSRVPNAGLRPAEGRPKGGPRCVPQALEVVKVGRNDGGIIMIEKEQKKNRFKVSDRNSLFRKRSLFLNRELRSDTLKRSFFCSFSMIFIPV